MNDRPSEARVASIYNEIFGPEWNVQKLAHSAIQGHLLQKVVHGPQGAEVVGRSIVWRLMLATDSPLNASTGLQELRRLRADYVRLLKDSMRAPDGTFPESLVVPGETDPPRRTSVNMNLAQNNPLSLDESNPWKDYFTSLELRKTIQKDVERTFPDVDYFRSPNAQRMLADILFVYSKANDVVSYRQGMHELLAPVLWALDYDSLEEKGQGQTDEMHEFLSRDYVPADAWAIFSRIMNGAGVWYEWREPAPTGKSLASLYYFDLNILLVGGPPSTPWVAPINEICNKIGGEYLRACDPALGARMSELGIEPQMYGIRWLRLLFTREFPWRDALILWDALFATDPSMELVPWVCVAMLIRIRNLLIPAEYTEALTYLLRYPPPPSVISSDPSDATLQTETLTPETHILVQQALMLRANPAPATGSTIVLQNRSALNIPIEAPSPPPPAPRRGGRRRSIGAGAGPGSDIKPNVGRAPRGRGISRHVPEGSLSGLAAFNSLGERADVLAKGLWDIGGTVGNRVSEMRKNLPDLVRTPSMAAGDSHAFPYYQVIPGSNDDLLEGQPSPRPSIVDTVRRSMEGLVRPSMERQSSADVLSVPAGVRSPRTRFEVEREVGEVKAVMRKLGEGIGIALEGLKDGRKDEAMESLEYIQMVLGGAIELGKVDEERVLGATEAAKRREAEELSRAEQEKEIADAEEARVREEQERQRAQEEEEKQRKLEEERAREQDPLQASPVVRSAPLMQTSPPRIRTTRAPWERATGQVSVQSGYGPAKTPVSSGRNTPPVQSGRMTPLAQSGESTPSMQGGQKPVTVQPVSSQHERQGGGGNDPLGAGLLG